MDVWNEIWANELYRKLILSVLVLSTQAVIRSSLLNYVINQFFNIYGDELESISRILKIRLGGLASAYTAENNLPREAVSVHAYFYWRSDLQSMATISDR